MLSRALFRLADFVGSALEFGIETFDGTPIPVRFMLESEAVAPTRFLEPPCAVNEKHDVSDAVFLAQHSEAYLGLPEMLRRSEFGVEELVSTGIDRRVQPVSLVIDLDHSLVDRDVIRVLALGGLSAGLLHPVVNA